MTTLKAFGEEVRRRDLAQRFRESLRDVPDLPASMVLVPERLLRRACGGGGVAWLLWAHAFPAVVNSAGTTTVTVSKLCAHPLLLERDLSHGHGRRLVGLTTVTLALRRLATLGLLVTRKLWDRRRGQRRFVYQRRVFGRLCKDGCVVPERTAEALRTLSLKGGKREGNGWPRPGSGRPKGLTNEVLRLRREQRAAEAAAALLGPVVVMQKKCA